MLLPKIFAPSSLTVLLAIKTRSAIMELTHLHNAKHQLDLNQNHVVIMDPSNTGMPIIVNINAHQQDTANGISNHKMDHHQLINQTHAM
jgi:transposase